MPSTRAEGTRPKGGEAGARTPASEGGRAYAADLRTGAKVSVSFTKGQVSSTPGALPELAGANREVNLSSVLLWV